MRKTFIKKFSTKKKKKICTFYKVLKEKKKGSNNISCSPQKTEEPKYSSKDEWINKMQYIHTREHCSALKRKEILIPATLWKNLNDTLPSKISQTWQIMPDFTYVRNLEQANWWRQNRAAVTRDRGRGNEELPWWNVLDTKSGDGYTRCECT